MNYNTFNLNNVLDFITKGLNIANKAIPVYKQVSPMISSSKKIINKSFINKPVNYNQQKKELDYNNPKFFL